MLSTAQAWRLIVERAAPVLEVERVPLAAALGRVLAEAPCSDVDLPPFEKSAMDGFAVHSADFAASAASQGERTLPIVGESRAGTSFSGKVPAGACAAIYTGAELPAGTDAVVMVERSELLDGGARVRLRDRPEPGQHVCHRGQDLRSGQTVLASGRRLRAVDLALLAAVGSDPVPVLRRPKALVLTTGDELVAPQLRPGPGQIREGNTYHLSALCAQDGADVRNLGVVRDEPALLERAFAGALEACDVLITTGGVSMGKYDLVAQALAKVGVQELFHRVAVKPGKPLWFGTRETRLVFALPGNPVSCLVNHTLFVGPALRRMGGEQPAETPALFGRWEGKAVAANAREQYLPVTLQSSETAVTCLRPVRFSGSADVVGVTRAQALAVVGADRGLAPGEVARYLPLT